MRTRRAWRESRRDAHGGVAAPRRRSFPTVDRQDLSADPTRMIRGEEQYTVGDVARRPESPHGDPIDERALALRAVRLPLPFGRRVRSHEPGRDAVDRDAPRP